MAAPIQALVVRDSPEGGDEEGIYLYDEAPSTVRFARVETGITGDTEVEVISGVAAGDAVVTGPFRALREIEDGDEVRLKEEDELEEG